MAASASGAASAKDDMRKDIQDLLARVATLEIERDDFKSLAEKMMTLFPSDKDSLREYKKGEIKTINSIIKSVGNCNIITTQNYDQIEMFSDTSIYTDAAWFRNQLIAAFEKLYFNTHCSSYPSVLTFDKVKSYLHTISQITEREKILCYITALN
jgi:hypothetical protein